MYYAMFCALTRPYDMKRISHDDARLPSPYSTPYNISRRFFAIVFFVAFVWPDIIIIQYNMAR